MLPNDNQPLCNLFGSGYALLHNLSPTEAAVVDVLSQGRNFAESLENQIESLKKQLRCLELIQKLNLPNLSELERLAQRHREASYPFTKFQLTFKTLWDAIHGNLSSSEIALLNTLFPQLNAWIEMQHEYASEKTPNLINVLASGEQPTEILNALASMVLREKAAFEYKSTYLRTEDIPGQSITLLNNYISFGVAAKLMFSPQTGEAEIRTIYSAYMSEIFRENGTQYAEFMFRQELGSFLELACSYFASQFVLSDKLFELTYSQKFLINRRTTLELFTVFAKTISLMGFPSDSIIFLHSCLSLSGLISFDTGHNFAQISENLAKESFWPLAWLGLGKEQIERETPEWRAELAKHIAAIPNADAKLWVERALKALHLPKTE